MDLHRSSQLQVRNPVLGLPSACRLKALDPEVPAVLRSLLLDLSVEAKAKAETNWKRRKGFIAAYWRAVAIYARHIAQALR